MCGILSSRMLGLRLKSKHLPMHKIFSSRIAIGIARLVYVKYFLTIHANSIRSSWYELFLSWHINTHQKSS